MEIIASFIVCGSFCLIGQIIYDHTKLTPGHITSLFVVFGGVLDLFHIYDKIIKFGGMGARLPIVSFGHSLSHAALLKSEEMGVLGIFSGMFDMVSVGISAAIFFAFVTALLCKPKS